MSDGISTARGRRVFISYSHRHEDEVTLANHLVNGLVGHGAHVFIDTTIPVGTNWVEEIERRVSWCDVFVLLLSQHSMSSEMVQGEVRLAMATRKTNKDRPAILPVRVRYFGPLDYQLDSLLGRIQYARWESAADSARVLSELLSAMKGGTLPDQDQPSAEAPAETVRPLPRIDPRSLSATGGALPSDDALYVTRPADAVIDQLASLSGRTLVIKGSRQMGKSSLLVRYLAEGIRKNPPKRVAFVDLSILSQDDLASYGTLLSRIARAIVRSLQLVPADVSQVVTQQDLTWFIEDHILAALPERVVFAFDAADRVLGRPYQADFFTMFRSWHNMRSDVVNDKWRLVDLALVISTEPYLLINDSSRSIFSVGQTVEVQPFTPRQYVLLNEACGAPLQEPELQALRSLLGGHPYLTRLALYRLVGPDPVTFPDLMAQAADERGPFGEHLRALILMLHGRPDLLNGVRAAATAKPLFTGDVFHRLTAAGLVRREGAHAVPGNELYGRFFRATV